MSPEKLAVYTRLVYEWGELISDTTTPDEYAILTGTYETLTSMGHRGPPYKEGGPFNVTRFHFEHSSADHSNQHDSSSINGRFRIVDAIKGKSISSAFAAIGQSLLPTAEDLKTSYDSMSFPARDLNALGSSAIRRFSPLNPGANALQALGELLLDGLPSLVGKNMVQKILRNQSRLGDFAQGLGKSVGSEVLNVEFGWKPLLSDLQDIYKTWNTLNSRMGQIIRDNNKPVRRRGILNETKDSTTEELESSQNSEYPIWNSQAFDSEDSSFEQSKITKTTIVSEKTWFAGRFRYYIPDVTDDRWSDQAKRALFGLNPTPSLIYELMPWSWLVDWFTNVGDVLANLSSNGIADLVIDYAYVMSHYKKETTYDMLTGKVDGIDSFTGSRYPDLVPRRFTFKTVEESKTRVAASPFGFGLQIGDLSDRQFAILGALALSRQNFV